MTDTVLSIVDNTDTISITEVEPVLITNESGSIITVISDASVLVESKSTQLLVTGLLGPQGVDGINEEDIVYSKRVDFVGDTELYKAEAAVGSAESSPVWRIRKITIDGDVTETWASGTALFDKVWTNRTNLIYS